MALPSDLTLCQKPGCEASLMDRTSRLLNCKHGFCDQCLTDSVQFMPGSDHIAISVTCPKCKTVTPLRLNLTSLPNWSQVLDALVGFSPEQYCQPCGLKGKDSNAQFICVTCEKFFCDECKTIHEGFPALRNHNVLARRQPADRVEELCPVHKNNFAYFCHVCYEPLCIDCLLKGDHVSHSQKVEDITEAIRKARLEIDSMVLVLDTKAKEIEEKRNVRDIDAAREQILKDINEAWEAHKKALEDERKRLSQKLEESCHSATEALKKECASISSEVTETIQCIAGIKNEGSDLALVCNMRQVHAKYQSVRNKEPSKTMFPHYLPFATIPRAKIGEIWYNGQKL